MKTQNSSLELSHFPVMLSEVVKISSPNSGGLFVDCTFGGGGYSKAILQFPDTKVTCKLQVELLAETFRRIAHSQDLVRLV